MQRITLKITSAMPIGGKRPGDVFAVEAADGLPLSHYWRSRLVDESAVIVLDPPATPPAATKAGKQQKD